MSDEVYTSTAVNNVEQVCAEVTGGGAPGLTEGEKRRLSDSLNRLLVVDLKSLLLEKGQITSGNKATLLDILLQSYEADVGLLVQRMWFS